MNSDNWLDDLLSNSSLTGSSTSADHGSNTSINDIDALGAHHHYHPNQAHDSIIIGHPEAEITHWHLQESSDSCAIAAQQFGIENITHQHLTESQLRTEAEAHGWYHPGTGTSIEDFGKLLTEHTHIPVESNYGGTIAEIEQKLAQGEEVFVGVNAQVEWLPDHHSLLGQAAPDLFDPNHFAGQPADHVVQVIGVEINPFDPCHNHVIVNDSGSPDGQGVEIPVDQFQQAMKASHNYVAATNLHGDHLAATQGTNEQIHFGCEVTTWDHSVFIDNDKYGTYNGNSFYWNNGNLAGNWNCESHHAFNSNGQDLGYAKTWNQAALLIYKQG